MYSHKNAYGNSWRQGKNLFHSFGIILKSQVKHNALIQINWPFWILTLLHFNPCWNYHFLYSLFKSAKYLPSIFCEFKFVSDREQLCKEYFLVASFHSSSHRYAPVPEQNLNDYMTQGINWSTFEQRIEKMTLTTSIRME